MRAKRSTICSNKLMAEMSALSDPDRQALIKALAQLPNPVRLRFFAQTIGCETCDAVRQLLNAFVQSSDKIALEELNVVLDRDQALPYGFDRAPALALVTDRETGIRFIGAPLGYEVASLVEAIRIASHRDSGLTDARPVAGGESVRADPYPGLCHANLPALPARRDLGASDGPGEFPDHCDVCRCD